jgi:chemotaxis protein CheD
MEELPPAAEKLYLNPAELVLAESPALVTTVLGSCVAVTFYYRHLAYGTICHAVLPSGKEEGPGKYVDQSIAYMLDFFRRKKIRPHELVAKVFGGADMFAQLNTDKVSRTIGSQNIQAALESLKTAGIEPAVIEVGGQLGRKLIFHTASGEIFMKRIHKEHLRTAELQLAENRKRAGFTPCHPKKRS